MTNWPAWDDLPVDDRMKVLRLVQYIEARDFARLNMALVGLSSVRRKSALLRSLHEFGRTAVKLKLDITADNRAEIGEGLEASLAPFETPGLYEVYAETLRPVIRSFALLLLSIARSAPAKTAIVARIRRFAATVRDNALARSLDELEHPNSP